MNFCLPKFAVDKFVKSLPQDISKLTDMTSAERRAFFSESVGAENAKQVNALFESKLLLKNQQAGIINWAKKVANLKPEAQRDILSKVNRMTQALEPKDLDKFLEDFAEKKLGMGVTVEEAGNIAHLAKTVEEKKALVKDNSPTGSKERLEYGMALVEFKNYISDLKVKAEAPGLKDYLKNPGKIIGTAFDTTKGILSTLDNSFFGRQGIKVLFTNPTIWTKNFLKSFPDLIKQATARNEGGILSHQKKKVVDAIKADVYSRPNAINGDYARGNLAIGILGEDAFPNSIPGRIPLLGRLFSASEAAYNGAALRMRADLADKYFKMAEEQGINLKNKDEAQGIGTMVNSLTGRGNLGKAEALSNEANKIFFSIRFLKSNYDILTGHSLGKGLKSSFARKQAAINTLKVVGGIATTMYLADKLSPGSVDIKKHLGKIKIGNTWVDISGGAGSVAQLASNIYERLNNQKGKHGEQTGMDVVWQFLEGKLSPIAGVARDYLKGRTYSGKKPTALGEAKNVVTPLPAQTFQQIQSNPKVSNDLLLMILDGLGFSVSTPFKK